MRRLLFGVAVALLASPLAAAAAERATAGFVDTKGAAVGTASLSDGPHGLLLEVELAGLSPGPHAIHFHSVGTCADAAAGFKDSKGHVKLGEAEHGLMNAKGPEAGDLPNIFAGADGKVRAQLFNGLVALQDAAGRANLLDADGTAIVVHEQADDQVTQPIGGAGARIACAEIKAGR